MAYKASLSIDEAASVLNVSKQFLLRLIEAGSIASHAARSGRRLYVRDVEIFKAQQDKVAHRAMAELQSQAQELGFYDMGPMTGRQLVR